VRPAGGAYADPLAVAALAGRVAELAGRLGRRLTFMEVCGTHTHAIARSGVRGMLPDSIRLVSGPGCPVCVTPVGYLDRAIALAHRPGTLVTTFGDLMRVPSSTISLEIARAEGAAVEVVYSPRDAVELAAADPARQVVFLAVGFETTTPPIAAALAEAERRGIANFLLLPGNKVMPPPMRVLVDDPGRARVSHRLAKRSARGAGEGDDFDPTRAESGSDARRARGGEKAPPAPVHRALQPRGGEKRGLKVDGFLLPGHVSVITGWRMWRFLPEEHGVGGVVCGFTPTDVLRGIEELVGQALDGGPRVRNLYGRVVTADGNRTAQELTAATFEPADAEWRGFGAIPGSGLGLRERWRHRDASGIPVEVPPPAEPAGCRCGDVLRGIIDPPECPLFDRACTPDVPVGACMVSSEGSCAAWHRHERWHAGERT